MHPHRIPIASTAHLPRSGQVWSELMLTSRTLRRKQRSASRRGHAAGRAQLIDKRGKHLARKTIMVSDLSGEEIQDGKGATVSIRFSDARKGTIILDVTDEEGEESGRRGRKQARRGRRPRQQGQA